MDAITLIIKERAELIKKINAYDTLLKSLNISIENYQSNNASEPILEFPMKAIKEKQILWLFENVFHSAVKLSEIQDKYEYYSRTKDNVHNLSRRLKNEGKLVLVKYNDNNVLSFYGLPEWIDGDNFKEEFKPDPELLPEIIKSNVNFKK